jgi:predicted short-subunit dehydrogenase-like oxidoreductase (DUF2520 family)
MMATPPRLRVGLIGAGRVGVVLAHALQNAQHPVVAAHAVSENSQQRVKRFLPATDIASIEEVVATSQLLVFAVPDDVLPELIAGIASTVGFAPHHIVMHTSGRHGLSVGDPAAAQGAAVIAAHPSMTFTGTENDFVRLRSCPFAVTSNETWRVVAQALVVEMGGEPFLVDDAHRVTYHAALSHVSNHLNTLIDQSTQLLAEIGLDNPQDFLRPLAQASLENAFSLGIAGLTGPISRGDVDTVSLHYSKLKTQPIADSYRVLALATIERAETSRRITAETALRMRDIFQ